MIVDKLRGELKMAENKKEQKGLHPFVIIVLILLLAAVASYFIPAGEYQRIFDKATQQTIVDPDTFEYIGGVGFSLTNLMTAIPRGIIEAANVVVITLSIGGAFGVIKETGILVLGIESLIKIFSKNKLAIIFILFFGFAIINGFIGTPELAIVYIPVLIPLFFKLGYDSMVAVGLSLTATAAGFASAWSAPATTGLGQELAELPLFSGMGYRMFTGFILTLLAALYTAWYANRIDKDPTKSVVYESDKALRAEVEKEESADATTKYARPQAAGIITILFFFGLIFGVVKFGWGFEEMSGYFLVMGVTTGLVAGMNINEVSQGFEDGMKDMIVGAIIVGVARGIAVVLSDAQVMDTIIMFLASFIAGLPVQIAAVGMFFVNTIFNAVVASGSGKAVIALPIMIPLADMTNVSRQTAILAYQLGDGLTNILWPASGYFMAALAIGKTSYKDWVKWFWPLLVLWVVAAAIIVSVASMVGF